MPGRLLAALVAAGLATSASGPPQRIVSTTPSVTEILFALGLGPKVVGVTEHCRYPEAARKVPKIGTYMHPNLEAIAAARPDLVVIQKNPFLTAASLERMNLRVLQLHYESLEEIYNGISEVAAAAGVPERGAELNARLRRELAAIASKTRTRPQRSVLFVIGRRAGSLEGMIAVGQASYLNDLLAIAGGRNIFSDAPAGYPKISLEDLIARNPDVIFDQGDAVFGNEVRAASQEDTERLWARHSVLRAVKEKRVKAVASEAFTIPGPRMAEAALGLARLIHPEIAW